MSKHVSKNEGEKVDPSADRLREIAEANAPESGSNVVIAVFGPDKPGILAGVSQIVAKKNANVEDVSQTILSGLFTMAMRVDIKNANCDFAELKTDLDEFGAEIGMSIIVQHEEIFMAMHRV